MTRGRIIIATLACAGVVTTLAALARPWEVAVPGASRTGSPGALGSGRPQPSATDGGIGDFEASVWWRIGWRALDDADDPPDFERLTIGRMNGDIIGHIQLGANSLGGTGAGEPFVAGPDDGLVLYTKRVGDLTELHLVDTVAGEARVLASTRAVLHHADLAPIAGSAYFVTGPPSPGVWRVSLDGTDEPALVANPPEIVGAADAIFTAPIDSLPRQVTLRVDEGERALAVLTCSRTCVLRIIDLAGEVRVEVEGLDPAFREITDFVDGVVVIAGLSGYDSETGRSALIPDVARVNAQPETGWELPAGWSIEQRQIRPDAQVVGQTWYVAIGPNGEVIPIEAMGQGIGQG